MCLEIGHKGVVSELEQKPVIIKVRDLHQRFGEHHVLKGVDLDVYQGETLVLLGTSGGGKSVLMKHMLGLMQPWKGTVEVDGVDISRMNERQLAAVRTKMGMLFQNGALFDSMSVGGNIAFAMQEAGVKDQEEMDRRVAEVLEIVNLGGQQEKMPSDLSGGMRKRVALARAIVTHPACVLYDEPHAGLDPVTADTIDHLIKCLQHTHKMTNVVVTHEMRSVFRIADRVVYMKKGEVYWQGTPAELEASEDAELKAFVTGDSGLGWDQEKSCPAV